MGWGMTLNYVAHHRIDCSTDLLVTLYKDIRDAVNFKLSKAGLVIQKINTSTLHAKMLCNPVHVSESQFSLITSLCDRMK